jgi:L-threonylcarbamoyladenylate synthase
MLKSHYAPLTPFYMVERDQLHFLDSFSAIGAVCFKRPMERIPEAFQITLSPKGCLREAAQNLFGAMRKLDSLGLEVILCEKVPDIGIGRAINDRLKRAVAKL